MRFEPKDTRAAQRAAALRAAQSQRNRLVFLSALLVLIVAALFAAKMQRTRLAGQDQEKLPAPAEEATETIAVPPFDAAALDTMVADAQPGDRVLSEPAALEKLIEYARLLTPTHFRALGTRVLTPDLQQAIEGDPSAFRAKAFRVRGYVESIQAREHRGPPGSPSTEYRGTLRLEDGRAVHFVVLDVPHGTTSDSYLCIDGLFLKLYSVEGEGGWVEGPLIVGPRAVRSYPALPGGGAPEDFPGSILATVVDDTIYEAAPPPKEAEWALMAFARDLEPGAVDWNAAPELDNAVMTEMLRDGAAWRGRPVRLPVVENQGSWVEDPGENPARIDAVTTGWIGSWEWTNAAGVIHYTMPFAQPELQRAKSITGRGFFFRDERYEAKSGLRVAPLLVMASIETFTPPEPVNLNWLLYGLGGLTIGLVLVIWVLLMRDRRRSHALREELVRRRRARRSKDGGAQAGATPPAGP
jgi:hypothetical protein